MRKRLLLCSLFMFVLFIDHASGGILSIGMNLAGPADWGSEWPFVDVMKYCRSWITCNSQWVEGGENAWDTEVIDQIPCDEQGYPLQLPFPVPGTETTQLVRTVWANTESMQEGVYVVLYDGQGELGFWGDAEVMSHRPGRYEIYVTPGIADIFTLEVRSSAAGDHICNIRVLMPGTEATYLEDPWCQAWLEKLEPFKTLRFMDWGLTNNSPLQQWVDRPHLDDYTYTLRGIPCERWIELCNLKQADAWVCIPHLAEDEYIREMARLFRENVDPEQKIYVEYSNEIWNWMFNQTHYCFEEGDQAVDWPERIVPFIQNALDIWTEEFQGQLHRLVRTVGVQAAWQDVSNRIVFNMRPGSFDAFAPAAYFGFTEDGIATLAALGENATADDVLPLAREGMLEGSYPWLTDQFHSIAVPLDIPMIFYEGGQHLTPDPFGSEQPYNQALMDVQTHPGMYDLYSEWFDSLRTLIPEDREGLFMNFSFISPKSGRYGSWGALEHQFDQYPPYLETSPKYQALLDNMERHPPPGDVNGDGSVDILDVLRTVNIILQIDPAPSEDELETADLDGNGKIDILDAIGIVMIILGG